MLRWWSIYIKITPRCILRSLTSQNKVITTTLMLEMNFLKLIWWLKLLCDFKAFQNVSCMDQIRPTYSTESKEAAVVVDAMYCRYVQCDFATEMTNYIWLTSSCDEKRNDRLRIAQSLLPASASEVHGGDSLWSSEGLPHKMVA